VLEFFGAEPKLRRRFNLDLERRDGDIGDIDRLDLDADGIVLERKVPNHVAMDVVRAGRSRRVVVEIGGVEGELEVLGETELPGLVAHKGVLGGEGAYGAVGPHDDAVLAVLERALVLLGGDLDSTTIVDVGVVMDQVRSFTRTGEALLEARRETAGLVSGGNGVLEVLPKRDIAVAVEDHLTEHRLLAVAQLWR
jgi:hypothetical protein